MERRLSQINRPYLCRSAGICGKFIIPAQAGITGGGKPRPYEGCRFIRQTLQNAKIPRPRRGGLYALPKNEALRFPFFGSPASGALL